MCDIDSGLESNKFRRQDTFNTSKKISERWNYINKILKLYIWKESPTEKSEDSCLPQRDRERLEKGERERGEPAW